MFNVSLGFAAWLCQECNTVSMPKTSVHKNAGSVFSQNQIRMPRQPLVIKPIAEAPTPQSTPHNHLRLRVLATNRRHVLVPLFRSKFIHLEHLLILLSSSKPYQRAYTSVLVPAALEYKQW